MDLFFKNLQLLASQDVNWCTGVVWITCGLLWCFYQLFGLSFWRHPFTAEDPLVSKRCNATFLQIWWRNKLLDVLRASQFSNNLHFMIWNVVFMFLIFMFLCLCKACAMLQSHRGSAMWLLKRSLLSSSIFEQHNTPTVSPFCRSIIQSVLCL